VSLVDTGIVKKGEPEYLIAYLFPINKSTRPYIYPVPGDNGLSVFVSSTQLVSLEFIEPVLSCPVI
jgi:hypothetical protein